MKYLYTPVLEPGMRQVFDGVFSIEAPVAGVVILRDSGNGIIAIVGVASGDTLVRQELNG